VSIIPKLLCCTLVTSCLTAPVAASGEPLRLDTALRDALGHHPRVRALAAETHRLQGELTTARQWVPDNPELGGDWTNRDGPDDTTTDWEVSLSQRVEVAGQRGHRVARAHRRLDALEAELAALRVAVASKVREAFLALSVALRREQVAAEMVALNDRLVTIARARYAAGDVADADVALASLARSEALRRQLEETRATAAARRGLAVALGLERLPAVEPGALVPPRPPLPLGELEPLLEGHPRLAALDHEREAAEADLALARAARFPDLTVNAHAGEEESRDTLLGVGLSLPLPLFHRQQGAIGAARTDGARLAAEADRVRAELRQEVARARAGLVAALEEVALFDTEILPGLDTHLRRIHRAYELGEMDLATLTVTQAQVVAARFDHLQALLEAWQARIDLDRAMGRATSGPEGAPGNPPPAERGRGGGHPE
jgi:cobalt-zinc-cadmium efflux system outer membrane protein